MRPFAVIAETIALFRAFITSPQRRAAIRGALAAPIAPTETAPIDPQLSPPVTAYADLTPVSEAFLRCTFRSASPRVNVVLVDFRPDAVFAGVKTALESAAILGELSGRSVRLVLLAPTGSDLNVRLAKVRAAEAWLAMNLGSVRWSVLLREDLDAAAFGFDDVWLATHWWTAHALDVAARNGRLAAGNVIYLIQDYEPGFVGLSTESAIAEATYRAGFRAIANSRPLADYLATRGVMVPAERVFAPNFDEAELREAAGQRQPHDGPTRVFFYGRPSKPRNMYRLGVAALRLAAEGLAELGVSVEFMMAGEAGGDVDLGAMRMRNLGVLTREEYFRLLPTIDVALSLQATPHPSHPPFDFAISGARVVVNEFEGTRAQMHDRIAAVDARPETLAEALVAAVRDSGQQTGYAPLPPGRLGGRLRDAIADVWGELGLQADGRAPTATPVRSWAIRIAAPPGGEGDLWGDAMFAEDLARGFESHGCRAVIVRRGEPTPDDVDAAIDLRGLYRGSPHPTALSILWVISHPDQVTHDELAEYDLAFAAGESWAVRMSETGPAAVATLLQATNPERFSPGPGDRRLQADVLFVGRTRAVFRPIVRDAIAAGLRPTIYGDGWSDFIDPGLVRAEHLPADEVPAAYRSAGVVLNDHWEDMRVHGFLSNRLFDAVVSGARVVSDPITGLERFGGSVRAYRSVDELRTLAIEDAGWPDANTRMDNAKRIAEQDSFTARAAVIIAAADQFRR